MMLDKKRRKSAFDQRNAEGIPCNASLAWVTPISCSYKAVNWAFKKSLALEPKKCRYSLEVTGLARVTTNRWRVFCESSVKTDKMPAEAQHWRGTNLALISTQTYGLAVARRLPPMFHR
ncbi:hypothetical protein HAX54_028020, partial [Datura stramonium]|nr:hypothetical protein [Datura stramonium]